MNGGCRKLATEKVPRGGLQGDLAANSYRKSRPTWAGRHGHPPRTKKNPCSAALGRWREGSKERVTLKNVPGRGSGGVPQRYHSPQGEAQCLFRRSQENRQPPRKAGQSFAGLSQAGQSPVER